MLITLFEVSSDSFEGNTANGVAVVTREHNPVGSSWTPSHATAWFWDDDLTETLPFGPFATAVEAEQDARKAVTVWDRCVKIERVEIVDAADMLLRQAKSDA